MFQSIVPMPWLAKLVLHCKPDLSMASVFEEVAVEQVVKSTQNRSQTTFSSYSSAQATVRPFVCWRRRDSHTYANHVPRCANRIRSKDKKRPFKMRRA